MMQKILEWGTLSSLNQKFQAENKFLNQKFDTHIEDIPFGSTIINQNSRTLGDKLLPIATLGLGLLGGAFGLSSLLSKPTALDNSSPPTISLPDPAISGKQPNAPPLKPIDVEGIINWEFDPNKSDKPKIDINLNK